MLRGLVSGTSVWISVDKYLLSILESIMLGTVEISKDFAYLLHNLLKLRPPPPTKLFFKTDTKELETNYFSLDNLKLCRFLVRFGPEETIFLMHVIKCLLVYKSLGSSDAIIQLLSGIQVSLCNISADEMLHEFIKKYPRFPHHYIAYFHYRSKGWITRSGLQFGSDFVLYQFHPTILHSLLSLLIVPTAIESIVTFVKSTDFLLNSFENINSINFDTIDENYLFGFLNSREIDSKLGWKEICCLTRLQTQVCKRLMLCYVSVLERSKISPCKSCCSLCELAHNCKSIRQAKTFHHGCIEIEDILDRAFVEEVILDRWNPQKGTKINTF